jgi:hypothetical protein
MLTMEAPRALQVRPAHSSAVVWIDESGATVAATRPEGGYELKTVLPDPGDRFDPHHFLAHVVDEIADRERVVILGPSWPRTALEREYVTIYHRPARLVDVEPADASEREHLVERLAVLAS